MELAQHEIHNFKQTAEKWTKEAGREIREKMQASFNISAKAHQNDLVTDVDKFIESFFHDKITNTFPEHRLMGEEGSYENIKDLSGTVWILDPIDGTINFVHQESYFAVSVGIFHDGEPAAGIVYDVMHDEMFAAIKGEGATLNNKPLAPLQKNTLAESLLSFNAGWVLKDRRLEELVKQARGIRSYGVAALEMAYVAAGRLDGYISFNLAPWDIAGGYAILMEVGGKVTNYKGEELNFLDKDTLIAANPWVYEEIEAVINKTERTD